MAKPCCPCRAQFATETIWNTGLAGTGAAVGGQSLTVGREGDWSPEHLLLLAAESCVMSTLLRLATERGIELLGYVSSGSLEDVDEPDGPIVTISICAVVATEGAAATVRELASALPHVSTLARALRRRLRILCDVRCLCRVDAE